MVQTIFIATTTISNLISIWRNLFEINYGNRAFQKRSLKSFARSVIIFVYILFLSLFKKEASIN